MDEQKLNLLKQHLAEAMTQLIKIDTLLKKEKPTQNE